MGLIDLYPDNKNRARRLDQLSSDIGVFLVDLTLIADSIQDSLDEFHGKARDMLLDLNIDPSDPRLKPKIIKLGDGVVLEVIEYLAEFFAFLAVQNFVSTALLVRMAKNLDRIPIKGGGEIIGGTIIKRVGKDIEYQGAQNLERVAIKKLRFPKWIRFKAFAGGAAAALVITVAIELIVDSIQGAIVRDKLQKGIRGLYGPRARVKMALLANQKLKELIDKGIGDLDMMRKLGYSEEQLDKFLDLKSKEISDIVEKTGVQELAKEAVRILEQLDGNRNSFRDDDKMDKKNCSNVVCW
ncbi:hypothetical protein IWQ47_005083 [Aquimarina sp. EL_43]|uniref:hypothetical protein n=1 Tax=Aquimarina TaxID=290174 RepID=UPI000471EABF|nr:MULTISPECIES: hypothetical protein [Aquimarina]MBG6133564.1 hypothetical protein [Aquimarina sp. EL_35]MBG6153782.1 hypothetical protein [Aquimarina sp. EL_32]MBG6171984.1 hypothetical protein [Aquimarina sp. EL_43]